MTSQTYVSLQCRCGSLQGQALVPAPSVKYRIVCLCDDCQAYAHFLGQAGKILDANGGTDISPFPPSHIQLTHGGENLRCMRLSPKGMDRWYAGCCNTPIGNTLQSKKTPYVGVVHNIMSFKSAEERNQVLGSITGRVQGKYGIAPLPPGTWQTMSMGLVYRVLHFMLRAMIKKQGRPSPFFDEVSGNSKATPLILSVEERERLRPLCGPHPQK